MKMQIKKFKVFTWDRVLLYILPPVLLVVAFVAACITGTTPAIGLVILAVVTMAWFSMSSVLFFDRRTFEASIKGYTVDGTGIIPGYVTTPDIDQLTKDITDCETEIINFWAGATTTPISTFINYINGGIIGFTKDKIDLLDHPPTGPLMIINPGFTRWAVGATSGNWSTIEYSGEILDWPRAIQCIKHELGHQCLNAIGIDSGSQHQYMTAHGFKY